MKEVVLYGVYFFMVVLEIIIDFSSTETRSCLGTFPSLFKQIKVSGILLFHHFLSTFMMYGWLLPQRILLGGFMVASLSMLIEWYRFGYCRFTEYINRECGQKGYFRDLLWRVGWKDATIYDSYTYQHLAAVIFFLLGLGHFVYFDQLHE